jgi:hypothetical protein
VGRTRLGRELAAYLTSNPSERFPGGGVALDMRMESLAHELRGWDRDRDSHTTVLAAAIFHAVHPDIPVPKGLTLAAVKERIVADWGKRLVALHVDEFEMDTVLASAVCTSRGALHDDDEQRHDGPARAAHHDWHPPRA